MLPPVKEFKTLNNSSSRLLIIAEGFEKRSLAWINSLEDNVLFSDAIICKYNPVKVSLYEEMLESVKARTQNHPQIIEYNRFEPTLFEVEVREQILQFGNYEDIYIDITVMSKLLIMIIMHELKRVASHVHFIYTEPVSWGPTQEKYYQAMKDRRQGGAIGLSSIGVGDIVRTPGLSSIVMQNNPAVLIAGLSFNEQIVRILVNEINPERLILINQGCDKDEWREDAIVDIHQAIIDEYANQPGLVKKYNLKEYDKVFELLVEIYKKYWLTNRIIISPTGYKMHAISFALLKICCSDVHIEYPTPDSYLFEDYSSEEILATYEILFTNYREILVHLVETYELNG